MNTRGTVTGRHTSSDPHMTEVQRPKRDFDFSPTGRLLHTVEPDLLSLQQRQCTSDARARRDAAYALAYGADYGALEARVLAQLAGNFAVVIPPDLPPGKYTVELRQELGGRLVVHPGALLSP